MTHMNTQDTKSPQRMLTLFMSVLLIALFMVSSFSWAGSRNDITDHTRLGTEFSLTNAKSFGEFRNDTWHNTFSVCNKPAPADPAYTEITLDNWNNPAPDTAIHETVTVVDSSCYDPITKSSDATLACDGEDKGNWGKIATTGICGRVFQLCDQEYSYVKTWGNAVISGAPKTITTWTRIVNNRVNCQGETGTNDQMVQLKENDLCYPNPDTDKSSCVQNFPITGVKKPLSVTAITGDDMFKINKETLDGSFFEYQRAGDFDDPEHSLKWIAGTGDKDMMLPSGPLGGANAYSDYTNFMKLADDGKIGGVTTADACYAMKTSLCADIDDDEDGECGSAVSAPANTYGNLSQIPYSAFCNAGVVIDESETGTTAKWKCYAATAPVECEITIGSPVVNALCGTAHNTLFEPVTDAQFCLTGTQTATIGAWSWACNGSNGGNNAVCSTTAPVVSCGSANTTTPTPTAPSGANLCSDSSTPPVTDNTATTGTWDWTCGSYSCSVPQTAVVNCGLANGSSSATAPTSELCNDTSIPPVTSGNSDTTWDWTCGGFSCTADQTAVVSCGGANTVPTPTAPSGASLCSDTSTPAVTDNTATTGTWDWDCSGDGTEECSAPQTAACTDVWVSLSSRVRGYAPTTSCGPSGVQTDTAQTFCNGTRIIGDPCDGTVPSCTDFDNGAHAGGSFHPHGNQTHLTLGSSCASGGPRPCYCRFPEVVCMSSCDAPPPTPVDGICGTTNNVCTVGSLNDITDSTTEYLWECRGTGTGADALNCSEPIPVVPLVCGSSAIRHLGSWEDTCECDPGRTFGFEGVTGGAGAITSNVMSTNPPLSTTGGCHPTNVNTSGGATLSGRTDWILPNTFSFIVEFTDSVGTTAICNYEVSTTVTNDDPNDGCTCTTTPCYQEP